MQGCALDNWKVTGPFHLPGFQIQGMANRHITLPGRIESSWKNNVQLFNSCDRYTVEMRNRDYMPDRAGGDTPPSRLLKLLCCQTLLLLEEQLHLALLHKPLEILDVHAQLFLAIHVGDTIISFQSPW